MAKKKSARSSNAKMPHGLYLIIGVEIFLIFIHLLDLWIYNPSFILGITLRGQASQLYNLGLMAISLAFIYAVYSQLKWGWRLYLYYAVGLMVLNVLNQAISVGNRVVSDQILNFLMTGMVVCLQAIMLGYVYSVRKWFSR